MLERERGEPERQMSARSTAAGLACRLFLATCCLLATLFAWSEWRGWFFLAEPAERWLTAAVARPVDLGGRDTFVLRLLGGIDLRVSRLRIGGPEWAPDQALMDAQAARLKLRYADVFRMLRGEPLRIESLVAERLDLHLARGDDGRANWQFERTGNDPARPLLDWVQPARVEVAQGRLVVDDAPLALALTATFSMHDGSERAGDARDDRGIRAIIDGRYRQSPLTATLSTGSTLPWLSDEDDLPAVPITLALKLGRAALSFDGRVQDLLTQRGLDGRYKVSGPSLAALGDALAMTLPSTPAFSLQGRLQRKPDAWQTAIDTATIGRSRLAGQFRYETGRDGVPWLGGTLNGSVLWLADLGPAVGVPAGEQSSAQRNGRVLPDRRFDLPSLRAMNADIRIDIERFESGSDSLQAIAPLRGSLRLADGVLDIRDIEARLARGWLTGRIGLDGRADIAQWDVQLRGGGLRLEEWIRQPRAADAPPYVAGRVGGRIELRGQGRSTAELLASSDGHAALVWTQGRVSHLAVEAAGIDVAQALGVMLSGDAALPVTCGVADLQVRKGRVTVASARVDTADSTLGVEGSLSLVDERLDLVARAAPKDISPLSLRTPVRITGRFAQPEVSLEKGPLLARLLPAAALALVNPLAALLPLIDPGDDGAKSALAGCSTPSRR